MVESRCLRVASVVSVVVVALVACQSSPAPVPEARVGGEEVQPKPTPTPPVEGGDEAAPTPQTPAKAEVAMPFLRFAVERCLIDELARTDYASGWEGWFKVPDFVPEDAPRPQPKKVDPAASPSSIDARVKALEAKWRAKPSSHVVDCSFNIDAETCPSCPGTGAKQANYVAYLPKALFEDPSRVRSILMMVPGGRGGRTRYFLTPVPGTDIYRKKSGGLELKRRVEDYLKAKPDRDPPIVIALDNAGFLTVNGPAHFVARDAPLHIAKTWLGLDSLEGVKIGAEGISSGSRAIMEALHHFPDALRTAGLTAMHCGGRNGITQASIGRPAEQKAWADKLGARVAAGELGIRFSIGNRDPFWKCNKGFYDLFAKSGATPGGEANYVDCPTKKKNDTRFCSVVWGDFHLFYGHGHDYGVLLDALVPQLYWHLDGLLKRNEP